MSVVWWGEGMADRSSTTNYVQRLPTLQGVFVSVVPSVHHRPSFGPLTSGLVPGIIQKPLRYIVRHLVPAICEQANTILDDGDCVGRRTVTKVELADAKMVFWRTLSRRMGRVRYRRRRSPKGCSAAPAPREKGRYGPSRRARA